MNPLKMTYSTLFDLQPWRVSVCTSANAINVQGFIKELPGKFPDLDLDVQYYELPYNDIDHFEIKGSDVNIMILCHSINNRRFAITDVLDALYDKFLPNSANILGLFTGSQNWRICSIFSRNIFDRYRRSLKHMHLFVDEECAVFAVIELLKMKI